MNDILQFELPFFRRQSWVSEDARRVWEPRFQRIQAAWRQAEWQSVKAGIRRCAALIVSAEAMADVQATCASNGLTVVTVLNLQDSDGFQLAIGNQGDCARFAEASACRDAGAQGDLLGYPRCCVASYTESLRNESASDSVWLAALQTRAPEDDDRTVLIPCDFTFNILDLLCHALGLWRTFHLPCRFDCKPSLELAEKIRGICIGLGYQEEMRWLEEIHSWPVEWSALHGIAEIKTPVLRCATRTVATASRYTVRFMGTQFPGEGVKGLTFPFRAPRRSGLVRLTGGNPI